MVALLVSACGQSAGGTTGKNGLKKITLVQSTESLSLAPIYVARAMGYFKDAGFDVKFVTTRGDADAQSAVDSGSGQFLVSTSVNQLAAIAKDRPFKMLMPIAYPAYAYVIRSEKAKELGFSTSMTLAERAKLFDGLTIGIASVGGASDLIIRQILKENGINPEKDVKIVAVGSTSVFPALKSGRLDASLLVYPDIAQAEADDIAVPVIPAYEGIVPWLKDVPNIGLATTADFAKDHPDEVSDFVGAVGKALDLIHSDPAKAAQVTHKYFDAIDTKIYDKTWEAVPQAYPTDTTMSEDVYNKLLVLDDKIGDGSLSSVPYSDAVYQPK
jgi:NitT/TauT family transport system substrate-binding protein